MKAYAWTSGLDQLNPPAVERKGKFKRPQHVPTKAQVRSRKLRNALSRSIKRSPSMPVITMREPAQ